MKIRLNIDTQRFDSKPKGQQTIGAIRNRLCSPASIREIDADRLSITVSQGRTFTPAEMTGTKGDSWKGQQVICADIDNDSGTKDENGNKVVIDKPMTPAGAVETMFKYGIDPYFMYYTFSNRADWPKFRIVLILDETITDPNEAADLSARFIGIFNRAVPHCADTSTYENARLFFGGSADSVMYESKVVTPLETLRTLPEPPQDDNEADNPPPQQITKPKGTDSNKKGMGGSYEALLDQFEADKATFDLVGYVHQTTNGRPHRIGAKTFFNPCPICGHNDCFNVTGALWHCFSDNHTGIKGGTVIDYLMAKDNLEYGNACDIFKFDIMRYDREEWKRAWIERQRGTSEEIIGVPGDKPQPTTTDPAPTRKPANSILSIERFMEKAQTEAYKPIPTGIREFDNLVNGGFIKQTVVTLGAAPGAGKTILAQQIFEAAAENGTADILYFNLEMSEEQLIARSMSRATGLTQTEAIRGYAWTDDQRRKITTAANYYRAKIAPHIAYNPPDKDGNQGSAIYQNIIQIMEMEAALRDPAKPLITVIDYLQLLCDANGGDDVETIKKAMKAFKDFAINHNAVVFLVMAHSRAVNQDGNATQGAGRDTSAIEYSGDLQLSLNYGAIVDGTYNRLADMERAINDPANPADESLYNYRCLTVTKNRFGRDHVKCFLTFDGEQSRFDFTTKCRKYTPPKPNITPIRKKLY